MASTSVSGLVSGLDTSTIISQLMQLEAKPQTTLKTRVSTEQKVVTALQALNTKLAGIAAKAAELGRTTSWSPAKATSDNPLVTVKTTTGATPGSFTLDVTGPATSATSTYARTGTLGTAVATQDAEYQVTFTDPTRAPVTFTVGDGTMRSVADAVNASTTGLRATLLRTGTDATGNAIYAMQVSSATTGADTGFTISPVDPAAAPFLDGETATQKPGTDAAFTLNGQALTSSTNTVTGLMPGVDVTLGAGSAGQTATITVTRDTTALSDSVKAMVDAVNTALSDIDTLTAYDATAKKSGLLGGDSTLRTVRDRLLQTVSGGVGGQSLASVGIQTDRSGKLTFDPARFAAAYEADAAGTTARIAGTDGTTPTAGFADNLEALAKQLSDSLDGTVTLAIKGRQSQIRGWEDDIADWDVRLGQRQSALERQYAALEVALGQLQQQSSWLAGQISSLPTSGS